MPTTIPMCSAQLLPKQHNNAAKAGNKSRLPTADQLASVRAINSEAWMRVHAHEFPVHREIERRVRCAVIAFPERRR